MVNICEEELVGRTLVEGELRVELNPEYFSGDSIDLKEALHLIDEASIVNLVGNTIVEEAVRRGYAHSAAIRKIGGISFLMIYKFTSSGYSRG